MKVELFLLTVLVIQAKGHTYGNTNAIYRDLLQKDNYNPQVVPLYNQTDLMYVEVNFHLISIETVDDAKQSFVSNGFLTLFWEDEKLRWDPSLYGGLYLIHPLPKQIWRPRMVLLNTLDDRDLFGDDVSPVSIFFNGTASWAPGGLFTTSCSLSLLKYPFDEQRCSIKMLAMGLSVDELIFYQGYVLLNFYSENGEWDLLETGLQTFVSELDYVEISTFEIQVRVKRRPTFYLLNIILPFVFLSFLNLLIFTIPQESGEKIGYGITVLLALAVYLSIIGEMLPRSSNIVPNVIIYLFLLFVISTLSVIDAICIVYLYRIEERGEQNKRLLGNIHKLVGAITWVKRCICSCTTSPKVSTGTFSRRQSTVDKVKLGKTDSNGLHDILEVIELDQLKDKRLAEEQAETAGQLDNKYRYAAALIDFYSFIIFVLGWTCTTMWYFLSVTS